MSLILGSKGTKHYYSETETLLAKHFLAVVSLDVLPADALWVQSLVRWLPLDYVSLAVASF